MFNICILDLEVLFFILGLFNNVHLSAHTSALTITLIDIKTLQQEKQSLEFFYLCL